MPIFEVVCFAAVVGSVHYANVTDDSSLAIVVVVAYILYALFGSTVQQYAADNLISNASCSVPSNIVHNQRRSNTYPSPICNSWYHFCHTEELQQGKVMEFRALNKVFVLWRNDEGLPVCQDAYCIHLGANLSGGKVVDNCLQCPFHKWKFSSDGTVVEVPYLKNPQMCQTGKKLKTYPCRDYCGLVLVYFHADAKEPEFEPPSFLARSLQVEGWTEHVKWDAGFYNFSPVDMVDQAGDHAHFQTLHADFMIPWTRIILPNWLLDLVPLSICHSLMSFKGDDKEFGDVVDNNGFGARGKHYLYLCDQAGLSWNGKPMPDTFSQTTVMFIGPAIMVFNIPFTLGTFRAFVTTTPVEGGSLLRVKTWIDPRCSQSILLKTLAWWLTGISASQLTADVGILENKIRLQKPMIQPYDGPYNRTNAWLKQFYSEGSDHAHTCTEYKNDW